MPSQTTNKRKWHKQTTSSKCFMYALSLLLPVVFLCVSEASLIRFFMDKFKILRCKNLLMERHLIKVTFTLCCRSKPRQVSWDWTQSTLTWSRWDGKVSASTDGRYRAAENLGNKQHGFWKQKAVLVMMMIVCEGPWRIPQRANMKSPTSASCAAVRSPSSLLEFDCLPPCKSKTATL